MEHGNSLQEALHLHTLTTRGIKRDPYNPTRYLRRTYAFEMLGFPDLAAMDAYKALLLIDEVGDEQGEYHELVLEAVNRERLSGKPESDQYCSLKPLNIEEPSPDLIRPDDVEIRVNCIQYVKFYKEVLLSAMAKYLVRIGCLRDAHDYARRALKTNPNNPDALKAWEDIMEFARENDLMHGDPYDDASLAKKKLPNTGRVRREIYPWNRHEPQRDSKEVLELLNAEMKKVAPKLEVKITELPLLNSTNQPAPERNTHQTTTQLGVFAKEDIAPGEEILRERSLLTGNCRLHEGLCDACSAPLPDLNDPKGCAVDCTDCTDITFCSPACHNLAQAQYHPAICDTDTDALAKADVAPAKAADTLYMLLLFRAFAMAKTQATHPLDLLEVKYIWGDFTPAPTPQQDSPQTKDLFATSNPTLPFSFDANIVTPLHMLELMDVDIFAAEHDLAEAWVWNTLYAKFRGTASGRISPRDGRPEVAAVHPLWCLANHSCDPNVKWEWAGEVKFTARDKRVAWERKDAEGNVLENKPARQAGIRKGEEILNHYVDVELPVKQRREWGDGALGGACLCDRCVWESNE